MRVLALQLHFLKQVFYTHRYFVLSVAMSEMMLFCGLIATLLNKSQAAKWLLLFYGIFFFVMIIYMIIRRFNMQDPRKAPRKQSSTHMRSTFTLAANYTIIVWLMYCPLLL